MGTYDLCIIGAGMFGSSAARHASTNPSLRVCLVGPNEPTPAEYKKREIFGSYYDEGRIVLNAEHRPAIQTLAKQSIKAFRELEKLSGEF
ncbi:DAO domain-containing protein [Trichonephila clavipes]|nr:DAO domain-containing protein [Trichonephila clavipes]